MPNGIVISNLVKVYKRGRVQALAGVNVQFLPGRVHGLIGPNGSGKTTLMGCLLGLLKRASGTIEIDGLTPESLAFKAKLGYVPERLRFDMWMKAWDFMTYHDRLTLQKSEGREARITRCLERIGLERSCWKQRLNSFSRGMLQRIGLAQALLNQPQYLFLDEPTSGMDPAGVILFRQIVAEESKKGCLVLLNSHQLSQVERLCDEVHFIEKGRFIEAEVKGVDTQNRILCVRWAVPLGLKYDLKKFAKSQKYHLVEQKENEAFFEVKGDQGAQGLIAALVKAKYPLVEIFSDVSRLERYFIDSKGEK